jgi:hypothetical protein
MPALLGVLLTTVEIDGFLERFDCSTPPGASCYEQGNRHIYRHCACETFPSASRWAFFALDIPLCRSVLWGPPFSPGPGSVGLRGAEKLSLDIVLASFPRIPGCTEQLVQFYDDFLCKRTTSLYCSSLEGKLSYEDIET